MIIIEADASNYLKKKLFIFQIFFFSKIMKKKIVVRIYLAHPV
jgi:hypothetical protein